MKHDTFERLPEQETDKRYVFSTYKHTDDGVRYAGHVTVWADGLRNAVDVLLDRMGGLADWNWIYTEDAEGNYCGINPPPVERHQCPTCNGSGTVAQLAPASRNSDPETSRAAGKRHETDPRRFSAKSSSARLLAALNEYPMTAQEAALRVIRNAGKDTRRVSTVEACRRRVSDLKRAGYVIDSGERRHNEGSPDESVVWKVTLAGVFALEALNDTGWSA